MKKRRKVRLTKRQRAAIRARVVVEAQQLAAYFADRLKQ